jgi:hypothetical protein
VAHAGLFDLVMAAGDSSAMARLRLVEKIFFSEMM